MSFSIANSGLDAVTQQMNTVSNNIANAHTVGFKSGHTQFAALYAGEQPLGVGVTGIAQSISHRGNLLSSDRELNMAIDGTGFFIVRNSAGENLVTRAGTFDCDGSGYLNNNGMRLQGHGVDDKGVLQAGNLTDLKIANGGIPAKASTTLNLVANLKSDMPDISKKFDIKDSTTYSYQTTSQVYDSQGGEHQLNQYFVKNGVNSWDVYYATDGKSVTSTPARLTFDNSGKMIGPATPPVVTIVKPAAGTDDIKLTVDYSGTTQFKDLSDVSLNKTDGYKSGKQTGQKIDEDGSVYATYNNGERLLQGQIVMANFKNPDGLSPQNNTTWKQTLQSGEMLTGTPGAGLYGKIKSSMVEDSNVDLTGELMSLMNSQRDYQANTKVISTDSSMMNALFQAM
ncbi:flagellar hook protein FlgE [Rouxiella chamberiensis]|uniref:Flagellar hook protein FlgE n=1 Tax=Rouxiella chamberiensis TaxID=1513468 RepID=A0ABY7HP28_9GAMM|nr:flagellar hook protein FlgE [Rouxiella chamberiensis]WAT00656.1 flagellar hook protein FlgE [Rouxiella chamberiensis]